ncbi:hypothetical protein Mjas_01775 [Methanothermococcus sp. Ax23]|uniref:hypothetical protein n=1 Tax=Methanothermococcus sp. Ax23 TaxID=3156486 RepID=UPI003BA3DA82
MNDNWRDDNYADGHWNLNITENGVEILDAHQSGGYFHNSSFVFTDIDTNETWNVTMPYKNRGGGETYRAIIPLNGSNATIYNISGNTPDANKTLTYAPPTNPDGSPFFLPSNSLISIPTPIPIGALIISSASILYLINRRRN